MSRRESMNGAGDSTGMDAATVESQLATVDEALETGRPTAMDPEDRALQELALAVRAESPRPRPEFARRMDGRVGAGFPRARHAPAARARALRERARRSPGAAPHGGRPRRLRRPPLPALAGAASLILALAVAIPLASSIGETPTSQTDLQGPVEGAAPPVEPGGAGTTEQPTPGVREQQGLGGSGGVVRPGPGGPSPADETLGRESRRVERSASMVLVAGSDELQEVAEGIARIADQRGGFLRRSSLTTGEGQGGGGSFEIRLPVDELEAALAGLSQLGQVESLTQSGEDLTARFAASGNALQEARAELRELRSEREATDDREELEELRGEIRRARFQVRRAERERERLDERTSLATVSISLEAGEIEGEGLGAAFDDAVAVLGGVLAAAIRALGVLLPLGIVAALAWAVGRGVRRRRRESALA